MEKIKTMSKLLPLLSLFVFTSAFGQPDTGGTKRDLEGLQADFLSWKFGMFIHYNMGTYAGVEWSDGKEDPLIFNPTDLDCEQWADAAAAAKMKYATLTVKHTG